MTGTGCEVNKSFWQLDLVPYAPLLLAGPEPGLPTSVIDRDAVERTIVPYGEAYTPLVSSSFDPAGVESSRREQLAKLIADAGALHPGVLLIFHQGHLPQCGPSFAELPRDDGDTVNLTRVPAGHPPTEMVGKPRDLVARTFY